MIIKAGCPRKVFRHPAFNASLSYNNDYIWPTASIQIAIPISRNQAELIDYFLNPPVYPPNKKHKHPGLTRVVSENLISYFEYLDKIPTLGWPPVSRNMEGL